MAFRELRYDSSTLTHHVGLKGHNSMTIFNEEEDRWKFLESIKNACDKYEVDLLVYVLMDNHVHLILRGEIEEYQHVFESLGATFARWHNEKYGNKGPFWEQRYYNEPIENQDQFLNTAAYIFNNPVKAGMVERPQDYEWSNFCEIRDRKCEVDVFNAIDEIVNVVHLISFTISQAKAKIAAKEARKLELIRSRRVRDKDVAKLILDFGGSKGKGLAGIEKEKMREAVLKLWDVGANVFQIKRVAKISAYFVNKVIESV